MSQPDGGGEQAKESEGGLRLHLGIWSGAAAALLSLVGTAWHRLPVILLVLLAALIGYDQLRGERIVMEPFEVPPLLRDRGYTSQVIAHRLGDHLTRIRTVARTSMQRKRFVSGADEPVPQVVIPGAGISIESAVRYLGEFLGREVPSVSGEIVLLGQAGAEDPAIEITSRVTGKPPQTARGRLGALDDLVFRIAEHIYQSTQPYLMASYFYESDRARCIEAIQFVLDHEPRADDARAWNLWGLVLRDAGRYEEAARKFERATEVATDDADIKARALTNWSDVLRREQRYSEALQTIQRAVGQRATYPDAYTVWALILADLGESDAAIEAFRKAVSLDPSEATARYNWGVLLAGLERFADAAEQFRKAIDADPRSAAAHEALAAAMTAEGRLDAAEEYLRRAIDIEPNSSRLYRRLGEVLVRQDKRADARAILEQAKRLEAVAR